MDDATDDGVMVEGGLMLILKAVCASSFQLLVLKTSFQLLVLKTHETVG